MKNESIQIGVVKCFMNGKTVLESNLLKILYHFQNVSLILKINMEYTVHYFICVIENQFLPSLVVNLVVIQKISVSPLVVMIALRLYKDAGNIAPGIILGVANQML